MSEVRDPAWKLVTWLRQSIPTLLVLAALAGLAIAGHRNGWTIPKFGELGGGHKTQDDDWCKEHNVPESICVECNESLLPKSKGTWCKKHGVFDCPFEDPDVAQLKVKAKIDAQDLVRAGQALQVKERPQNSPKCQIHGRRIQFASDDAVRKMGIDIDFVQRAKDVPNLGAVEDTISAPGIVTYAQPLVVPVSIPATGRVWRITDKGRLGAAVKGDDVLALVDSAEVGKAKAEYQQALIQFDVKTKTYQRLQPLTGAGVPRKDIQEAEGELREAEIRLASARQALGNLGLPVGSGRLGDSTPARLVEEMQFLGIPKDLAAEEQRQNTTTASLIPVKVPVDCRGVVTAVEVSKEKRVEPGNLLFEVVDTSRMWVTLNVRLEDKKYLRVRDEEAGEPGLVVRFRPDGTDDDVFGKLVWISTAVDEKTRTIQVRAEVANDARPQSQLKANTFGTGCIILRREPGAIIVPNEAVHWEGDCFIVFVRDKNYMEKDGLKVFHVRTIRPGAKNGEFTEVIAGVLPGEVIAKGNSAVLRAELLRNQLGDG
jgi:cobalt-zinc-cadmium efflux system membrane fusion protein